MRISVGKPVRSCKDTVRHPSSKEPRRKPVSIEKPSSRSERKLVTRAGAERMFDVDRSYSPFGGEVIGILSDTGSPILRIGVRSVPVR